MNTKEILVAAKSLIQDPAHWCQQVEAKNSNNHPVSVNDPDACAFCSIGALRKTSPLFYNARSILNQQAQAQKFEDIINFNDTHTHQKVLQIFEAAISTLE